MYETYKLSQKRRMHLRLTILIVSSILASHCGEKNSLPSTLFGVWKTDTAQYENRFIEISTDKLTFGTGDDSPNIYFIRRVYHSLSGNTDEFIFECFNVENTEFRFIFYIENDANGQLMRLNNPRQVVWTKDSESELP